MAERRPRTPLYRRPQLWLGCVAFGVVLGATCPLWPEPSRGICERVSLGFRQLGLMQLGLPASSPAKDGGT